MGSKKAKSPDYRGAAEATAQSNKEMAEFAAKANRVDQYTPFGTQEWFGAPGTPDYSQVTTLTPELQAALDAQQAATLERSNLGMEMLGSVRQDMQTPEDFWNTLPSVAGTPNVPDFYGKNLPDMGRMPDPSGLGKNIPDPRVQKRLGTSAIDPRVQEQVSLDARAEYDPRFADTAFQRQMSLVGPTHEAASEAMDVQLRNQGLVPGTEAYDDATRNLRNQQGEEVNRMSADAVDRGRSEQQAEYLRELSSANFGLGSGAQRFGQESALAQLGLQGGGQRFGQEMGLAEYLGNQQGGAFQGQMDAAKYADMQRAQLAQEQLGFGALGFNQQMSQAQQQQLLRQQAIAEQQGREAWGLNKVNSAFSGQQVGMPSMPTYNTMATPEGANYLSAANMQGQMNQYNTNQANAFMNTLGGIGAAWAGS